ncbi:polysaccharide biosynthesis/export family protein [Aequorivita capsosiphonis]|uniref:polysaccharide biosynthesis/export family protein n=1 Tax=Aequorivita capsosiphonis TaxID=487317 RepID=UPI000478E90F|nr:polysaccharide biosynthesis/export family protein [Aequorivita capsosiphonis]
MIKKFPLQLFILAVCSLLLSSCVSNKKILYFQDAEAYSLTDIVYTENTIQPNDILSVTISAAMPETALPYNKNSGSNAVVNNNNLEVMKLQGYLVNAQGFISIPVLGKVLAKGETSTGLEDKIASLLETGGHLVDPVVTARLLNAKVTVLGEVKVPGTFGFTEQNLTVPQALGYAGDLTINGKRDEIMLIRELDGKRKITRLDLTTADWMDDPEYNIKPNDILVVEPNRAKVKTAGYVGSVTTIVAIASLLVSIAILLTR